MVSKGEAVLGLAIIGGFAAVGGLTLVKPAIENAKQAKNQLSQKIKPLKGGGSKSG